MANRTVGIAEMKLSETNMDLLVAPHLGSCIAVAVLDSKKKVGGMIHCLLPSSKSDPAKAKEKPTMYVDTGITFLLDSILEKGSEVKDLEIVAAGGAQINDPNNVFEIGKKNIIILKKLLWKNNLLLKSSDLGENYSRTLVMNMEDGTISVKANGEVRLMN